MNGDNKPTQLLDFISPPKRVVSLVPSMTESIFDLGAGEYLVGITDLCLVPEDAAHRLVRLGELKSPQITKVIDLAPELVIANQEENRLEDVEAIEEAGLRVWVTFPQTIEEAIKILWVLVRLFHVEGLSSSRIRTLEVTVEWTTHAAHGRPPVRVFCPLGGGESVYGHWWITFNRETYAHNLLSCCGGLNIFADRTRCYPLEADLGQASAEDPGKRDTRYPRVTPDEVIALAPEVILLPAVGSTGDVQYVQLTELLVNTPAVLDGRVHQIDNRLISWHGTRLAKSLAEIPTYLQLKQ